MHHLSIRIVLESMDHKNSSSFSENELVNIDIHLIAISFTYNTSNLDELFLQFGVKNSSNQPQQQVVSLHLI